MARGEPRRDDKDNRPSHSPQATTYHLNQILMFGGWRAPRGRAILVASRCAPSLQRESPIMSHVFASGFIRKDRFPYRPRSSTPPHVHYSVTFRDETGTYNHDSYRPAGETPSLFYRFPSLIPARIF